MAAQARYEQPHRPSASSYPHPHPHPDPARGHTKGRAGRLDQLGARAAARRLSRSTARRRPHPARGACTTRAPCGPSRHPPTSGAARAPPGLSMESRVKEGSRLWSHERGRAGASGGERGERGQQGERGERGEQGGAHEVASARGATMTAAPRGGRVEGGRGEGQGGTLDRPAAPTSRECRVCRGPSSGCTRCMRISTCSGVTRSRTRAGPAC